MNTRLKGGIMKLGELKHDIDIKSGTGAGLFGIYSNNVTILEGTRILKNHPEYEYLKSDPLLDKANNEEFLKSVVYAYIKDTILIENPQLQKEHHKILEKTRANKDVIKKIGKPYYQENYAFLMWYQDYLREQETPGILEKERLEIEEKEIKERHEWEEKQAKLKLQSQIRKRQEQQQLQQDLAAGTRVICPYCKSADTKKISVASRAVSVSLVGAASGKIGKQWHCNHCNSDF